MWFLRKPCLHPSPLDCTITHTFSSINLQNARNQKLIMMHEHTSPNLKVQFFVFFLRVHSFSKNTLSSPNIICSSPPPPPPPSTLSSSSPQFVRCALRCVECAFIITHYPPIINLKIQFHYNGKILSFLRSLVWKSSFKIKRFRYMEKKKKLH